jgi:hypothetical protein
VKQRDRWVAAALAVAVLLQGVGMVLLGRLHGAAAWQTMVVCGAVAAVVAQAWRVRLRLNHRIDMLLVMGAFGGLGMIAGWWVDLGFTAPPADASFHAAMGHGCHAAAAAEPAGEGDCCGEVPGMEPDAAAEEVAEQHGGGHSPWSMALTWMTGLMLLGAIPPGLVLTRCAELARSGWRRWVSTHVVGNVAMVAGMIVLGHWIGPGLGRLTGSNVVGGHVGMLVGMLVGMEAGMLLGEAAFGLKPWQEWRWEGDSGTGPRDGQA